MCFYWEMLCILLECKRSINQYIRSEKVKKLRVPPGKQVCPSSVPPPCRVGQIGACPPASRNVGVEGIVTGQCAGWRQARVPPRALQGGVTQAGRWNVPPRTWLGDNQPGGGLSLPGWAQLVGSPVLEKLAACLARQAIGRCPGGDSDTTGYSPGGRPSMSVASPCFSLPGKETQRLSIHSEPKRRHCPRKELA